MSSLLMTTQGGGAGAEREHLLEQSDEDMDYRPGVEMKTVFSNTYP